MHTTDATLSTYVAAVRDLIDADLDAVATARRVEQLNTELIPLDYCVPAELRTEHPGVPYTRNLVYADADHRFAVVVLVWGAFRETRIHDHLNWCVVRCLQGSCFETSFALVEERMSEGHAEVCATGGRTLARGGVMGLVPPPRENMHQLANAGWPTAITLHTYGDPGTRARVFDPVTRKVDIVALQFHNLLP